MSLPTRELRVLSEIEGDLRGCAPRLLSMFAIFTKLTIDDGLPCTESLPHVGFARRLWRRTEVAVAIPLALGMIALVAFLAISTAGVHSCRPISGAPYVAAGNPVVACPMVQAGQKH